LEQLTAMNSQDIRLMPKMLILNSAQQSIVYINIYNFNFLFLFHLAVGDIIFL
jgi:hypothetical protein